MKIFKEFTPFLLYTYCMYKLYSYFTNDGSVGLYSPKDNDIYHSTYGALTEAYEKFILPTDIKNFLKTNSEIKILDICFGIGYNTKSFINELLNFIYNDTIDTNNIFIKSNYSDTTYTDNTTSKKKKKIYIKAIDTDKNLAYLSPFFISNKKNRKNEELPFEQEKISKMLSKSFFPKYKLRKEVDILLLNSLYKRIDSETETILNNKKYKQYFDPFIINLYKHYTNKKYAHNPLKVILTFLHNIYYRNISRCYKNAINTLKYVDFTFDLKIEDARQVIINDNNKYNFIFLDAFTPAKCPCLWTLEFFKQLFDHLEDNGMLLTYSNSAAIRNAMINAGFYVGKIYSKTANKFTGTVAIKKHPSSDTSCHLLPHWREGSIINELSEYDLGLLKTKAGIFYRDKELSLNNEAIIAAHKIEVENSNLISSSRYIKEHKKAEF